MSIHIFRCKQPRGQVASEVWQTVISLNSTSKFPNLKCIGVHLHKYILYCTVIDELPHLLYVTILLLRSHFQFSGLFCMRMFCVYTSVLYCCTRSYSATHACRCLSVFVCSYVSLVCTSPHCMCTCLFVTERRGVYPSFPVHFLEIMMAISSSQ